MGLEVSSVFSRQGHKSIFFRSGPARLCSEVVQHVSYFYFIETRPEPFPNPTFRLLLKEICMQGLACFIHQVGLEVMSGLFKKASDVAVTKRNALGNKVRLHQSA